MGTVPITLMGRRMSRRTDALAYHDARGEPVNRRERIAVQQ